MANIKRIKRKLKLKANNYGPVNVYLNLKQFKAFKDVCEKDGWTASQAINEFIIDYLAEK